MADSIHIFDRTFISAHTASRSGETKLGEAATVLTQDLPWEEELKKHSGKAVVFFAAEDIGVRGNGGRPGAAKTWKGALSAICNIQDNAFLSGHSVVLLGIVQTDDLMKEAARLREDTSSGLAALRQLTVSVDKRVSDVAKTIYTAGCTPILIGGGHNNAYPMMAGYSAALGRSLNAINLDPHADFRSMEGRHSGNGFRYAKEHEHLAKYSILGLHESYNSASMLEEMDQLADVQYITYDSVAIRGELSFAEALKQSLDFVANAPFGVELDLDSIPGVPVSAATPSGFSAEQARRYIHACGATGQAAYLHICEGSAGLADSHQLPQLNKLIAYLVSDFLKSLASR